MVAIKQLELHQLLESGIQKSTQLGYPVLVSYVKRLESADPLSFFHSGTKQFKGHRTFWSDTKGNQLAGVGTAYHINGEKENRFLHVEQQWRNLVNDAIVEGDVAKGAGPMLLGGFTFDPMKSKDEIWANYPDASFMLPKHILSYFNEKTYLTLNVLVESNHDSGTLAQSLVLEQNKLMNYRKLSPSSDEVSLHLKEILPDQWLQAVESMASEIRTGKLDKVVLAREVIVEAQKDISLTRVLNNLLNRETNSFIFAFERGNSCFLGATPERLVKKEDHTFYTMCLAGSIKRGKTPEEDEALGQTLLADQKNLTEHNHVVEMIARAMDHVCSEIEVPDGPDLYKFSDIQHLYTPIIGRTFDDTSLLSVVQELHPTPALGGAPREIAMEKIREMEPQDRGWYASPIGWMDYKGNGEFAVAIRSGLVEGNQATLFAGCGIVGDSEPLSEYEETNIKFKPMLAALGGKAL